MDELIYNLASKLNESLQNNDLVKELNRLEKELNNSYEVYQLSQKKDDALDIYSKLKDIYPEDHIEVKNALKNLAEAKTKLNSHPLVKSYLSIYNQVRDLYMEIDDILFSDFKGRSC